MNHRRCLQFKMFVNADDTVRSVMWRKHQNYIKHSQVLRCI